LVIDDITEREYPKSVWLSITVAAASRHAHRTILQHQFGD